MHYTTEPLPPGTTPRLIIDGQDTPCQQCSIRTAPWTRDAPWSVFDSRTVTYTDLAGDEHCLRARWVTIIWEPPCLTLDVFTYQEGR